MEIVFFIVGLVFAALGGYVLWDARRFARQAVQGEGLVIGFAVNERRGKSGNRTTYSPVIRYRHQGEDYEFTGRIGSSRVKRTIGDPAAILISPDDPADARLDGPGMQIFGGIFLVLGLGTMAVFFSVFDFSFLSLIIAGGVIAVLAFQVKAKLRQHDIHGLEDMKSALAAAGQGRRREPTGSAGEESRPIITDPEAFENQREKNKAPGWVLVLFLLIGLGVLVGGGFVAKQRSDFLSDAQSAPGEVIDFERRTSTSDGKTTTTYYPVVRYQPPGHDAPVTFQHDTGSSSPGYSRGDAVTVLYSPDDPDEAIIDSGLMNWFAPGLMILLGGVFTLMGGLSLHGRSKKRRRKPEDVELEF
ncbi:MAG: DUF3592 domain-containing protein [Gammaproteobacteria bacterium]|nr:DUF3592 domain-containing protein [Gammaproteobacteria bacterium]